MPNWCSNSLRVENATSEQIKRITKAADANQLLNDFLPIPEGYAESGDWYLWCSYTWGTKWDIRDAFVVTDEDSVELHFNTAWSPPSEHFFEEMSRQLPGVYISNRYTEPGMDYCGYTKASDGSVTDVCIDIDPVFREWLKESYTYDEILVYDDWDHKDHGKVCDRIREAWDEVSDDVLDEALSYHN